MSAPRGALRVGDRIRYDGRVHTVIALSGSVVQLVSDSGQGTAVLFTYLVGSDGFELLNTGPVAVELTPFGLLEAVPEPTLKRAQFLERHLIEVETGLPPNPEPAAVARPEYDPAWRTLSERIAAKAAELSASGTAISERTLQRMRTNWRAQGLWGLVDQRAVRAAGAPGDRADERLVAAVRDVLAAQENASTGTRTRVMRQVEQLLSERYGPQEVPIPSRSSFYRLLNSLERNTYSFAAATTRRSQARRPNAPFTPTAAARPGEIIQIDTTPLDVLAILDDGVTGRVELTWRWTWPPAPSAPACCVRPGRKPWMRPCSWPGPWSPSRCAQGGRMRCGCRPR